MTVFPPSDPTVPCAKPVSPRKRHWGITAFAVMGALTCTGASSPTGCNTSGSNQTIGPSNGELVGAAVGIGAVIAIAIIVPVEISRSHHLVTGCVMTAAGGLELRTSEGKTYSLEGDAASIKIGDKVKVHGSKIKKSKDSTGPGVFRVETLTRDYGPCPLATSVGPPTH